MSHVFRFFVQPGALAVGEVSLTDDEAHHALHVARVRQGEAVDVFDGAGTVGEGTVVHTARHEVTLSVDTVHVVPRPATRLTIIQGALNREAATESLIRRGTELGVACFRFFKSDHSERAPRIKDKWTRIAIEACKQCRRPWLPQFETAASLREAITGPFSALLLATASHDAVSLRHSLRGHEIALIVGPEGDFSQEEINEARAKGAAAISFGDATFRSEVAATIGATLILYEQGLLEPNP